MEVSDVKTLRPLLFGSLIALALAAPLARAADETPSPWKFEFHGFVTASVYTQDQVFSNGQGQGLMYAAPLPVNAALPPAGTNTAASPKKTDRLYSGDVRNSRFAFSMAGPKVFDGAAQPRAYLEFDLFGPYNSGAYGTDQPIPRLRVAYAELKFGASNLQIGQQNQLVVPQIPTSISHIANPVTYGAGTIGWRTPGVRYSYTLDFGDKLELAAEAVKNLWSGNAAAAGVGAPNTPAVIGQGEASGMPMFQARAKLDGKGGDFAYSAYLVGVYHEVDLSGFGGVLTPPTVGGKLVKSFAGTVIEVGGKATWSNMVTLAVNYYTGNGTANMLGSQLNFGDIKDTGYWAMLSGNFTKEMSLMLVYGANTPDKADLRAWAGVTGNNARLATTTMGGMFKYQDGGYALGLEGYQLKSDYSTGANSQVSTKGTQVLLTGAYFF
jgi:hypothetical protein